MRWTCAHRTLALGGVLVACLAAGSLVDLPLSEALYDPASLLGRLGAAWGQAPQALALGAGGALLARTRKEGRAPAWASATAGLALNLFALYRLVVILGSGIALAVRAATAIGLLAVADALTARMLSGTDARAQRRYALFAIGAVCLEALTVGALKDLWARPRMRLVAGDVGATFQPWWIVGSGQREALGALGVAAEEFRSFPSGHTAAAACSMLLAYAPAVKPQLKRWSGLLFWGPAGIGALVGLSRIVAGAHFLSDVAAGFLITLVIAAVLARALLPRNREGC